MSTITPELQADLAGLKTRLTTELHRLARMKNDHGERLPAELREAMGEASKASLRLILAACRTERGLL